MKDQTLTEEIKQLEREGAFRAKVFEITKQVNDHYKGLMYDGGAQRRGFAVDIDDRSAVPQAHSWYSSGVEAAYLAVKNREDVPEDVKHGLASSAGLVHSSQR